MAHKKQYKTKQRDLILACLKANKEQHVTVEMIMEYLRARGENVGQTTVYRNLDMMVNEGSVFKYSAPEGMRACYQYADEKESCKSHYHLTCVQCGRLIHLQCNQLDVLTAHIIHEHKFQIDSFKTIFYGRCDVCLSSAQ